MSEIEIREYVARSVGKRRDVNAIVRIRKLNFSRLQLVHICNFSIEWHCIISTERRIRVTKICHNDFVGRSYGNTGAFLRGRGNRISSNRVDFPGCKEWCCSISGSIQVRKLKFCTRVKQSIKLLNYHSKKSWIL